MLSREDLNQSIRETISLMEEGKNYYLSKQAWEEIDKFYISKNWQLSLHQEVFMKFQGELRFLWNGRTILTKDIKNIDSQGLAFDFALAFPGALALAFAGPFALAIIEGNITLIAGSNNLIRYKTIKEERALEEPNNYLLIE